MPISSALWTTFFVASKSTRPPKLLQPSPTTDTRRPDRPRLRCSTNRPLRQVRCKRATVQGLRSRYHYQQYSWLRFRWGSYKLLVGHERELAPKDRNRSSDPSRRTVHQGHACAGECDRGKHRGRRHVGADLESLAAADQRGCVGSLKICRRSCEQHGLHSSLCRWEPLIARVKLDEDLPRQVADLFIARGHDTATVVEQGWQGTPDK